jgi:hypothetical protein
VNRTELSLEGLVDRIAKLERQNRFWRIGGVLAALLFVCSLAVGVRAQQNGDLERPVKSLEAQAFVLKDADGTTRGVFTVSKGVPKLELFGANGRISWSTDTRPVIEAVK